MPGTQPPTCTVVDDMDAVGDCSQTAPPDSFEPDVQWDWLGDGLPEVVLTNADGLALIEHDGTVTYQGLRPTGAPAAGLTWTRPATIHDFDGDGQASMR